MTQQYTPVAWQDETTSQQGTLINAERLNQMQTAHHYADGFEEVDTVPTADPGVAYHKVVYCTADSTFYRWDGTEWTKDIDDETKALLQQEIARATAAEGELAQDLADETTARETADSAMQADITAMQSGKLDKQTAGLNQTQVYAVRGSTQRMLTAGASSGDIPLYNIEHTLFAKMPSAFAPTDDTVVNYGWATAQIGAEATARAEADTLLGDRITAETTAREGADTALGNRITAEETRATQAEQANAQAIANTYTKSEADTLLAGKADKATTYTKSETDTLLALKADTATVNTLDAQNVKLTGPQTITGIKTYTSRQILSYTNLELYNSALNIQSQGYDLTAPPSYATRTLLQFYTGADLDQVASRDECSLATGGNSRSMIVHSRSTGGTDQTATFSVTSFRDGTACMRGPSRAYDPTHTTDVATIATLDAYTPMVRTSGNQTVGGIKEFTNATICAHSLIVRSNQSISVSYRNNNASYSSAAHLTTFAQRDKDDNILYALNYSTYADGHVRVWMNVRKADGNLKEVVLADGSL